MILARSFRAPSKPISKGIATTRGYRSAVAVCIALLGAVAPALGQTTICLLPCGGGNPYAFIVRSYQGTRRCLDYTPEVVGSPIFINDCALAHPVIVEELSDGMHTVLLHAGTKFIGASIPPVLNNATAPDCGDVCSSPSVVNLPATEYPLLLQNAPSLIAHESVVGNQIIANQHFTLDGDSIISTSSLSSIANNALVAKVQNARGAVGSPVVLGPRKLADNEFWDFLPTNGVDHDPTSGFVRVGYPGDAYCNSNGVFDNNACVQRLSDVVNNALPGTVVKLGTSLALIGQALSVGKSGVTIRGDRRGIAVGPQLRSYFGLPPYEPQLIIINQGVNDVRLTGLRLRGPSRLTDANQQFSFGVYTYEDNLRNVIDHNDLSDWTSNGVRVHGDDTDLQSPSSWQLSANDVAMLCNSTSSDPQNRPTTAFVGRNFIHHNEMQDAGYGVESYRGAYPFIMGNTFVSNRHSIAAGYGTVHTGYKAWYNLVLSDSPLQRSTFFGITYHTQDFDMHGTAKSPVTGDQGFGGLGGDNMDIFRNTFFGTNRPNFELRGIPCNYAEFHSNISLESDGNAVQLKLEDAGPLVPVAVVGGDALLRVAANPYQFKHSNPTAKLGVGDFDGDGADDLFLATGTAWYYSADGKTEWRFLSAKTDTIDQLLFGDFDGDGRTDVVAIHNGQFVVSWGGVSDWEVLNPVPTGGTLYLLPSAVTAMAVGDFDGDGIADIFYADGQTWWVSYGGNTPFMLVQTSGFQVKDLRFGDFDGNGTTDVFSVGSANWQVSYSPKGVRGLFGGWQPLRSKLTDSVQGLVVADFDGNGFADVAADCQGGGCWRISYGGLRDWTYTNTQPYDLTGSAFAGVGHFRGNVDGKVEADVLSWNVNQYFFCNNSFGQNTHFCIAQAAVNPAQIYSTQDMR